MMDKKEIKQLLHYVKTQARKAHEDLDNRMAQIPKVCSQGCDACCYQMVSVHTWEEDVIGEYIENTMHATVKKQVRSQLVDWWRDFRSRIRQVSRADPLTLNEFKNLSLQMIQDRVMCPFLVNKQCSIYPVRPAMCRSYVVTSDPARCSTELGRIGEMQGMLNMAATFGPESPHLPFKRYPHSMKPLAFAMTGALKVPAPSTPTQGILLGDLM
jgi:Fe-S-cluster containining protein